MNHTSKIKVRELVSWAWSNMAGSRLSIISCCLFGTLRVCLGLLFIWVSKRLVDEAVSGDADTQSLILKSVYLILLMLGQVALSLIVQYKTRYEEIRLKNRMRLRLLDKVLMSRWIDHQNLHSGDMISRLTEDIRLFCDVVTSRLQQTVVMLVQFAGAFVLFCFLSWQLALCIVAIMPIFLLLSKIYVQKTRTLTSEIRKAESDIQVGMQEGIQHHLVVQTLEAIDRVNSRVSKSQSWLYDVILHRLRFSVFSRGMVQAGFMACYLTAFLWSVWHLHTGVITFGTMTAFLQLVGRLQTPVVNVSQQIPQMVQALSSIERLIEIEGLRPERTDSPVLLARPVGIRFSDVSFRYPGSDRMILSGFSYEFKPGSRTVLMGETGVGKSTLFKLILGLLSPADGHVAIYDDKTETEIGANTRCNMSYVPQGNSLLDGTIRENLLLVAPHATEAELADALHIAVADFVYDLPDGLDSRCGELGCSLSEGQAQRIAIARALLRPGSILLLDEFNSSLDRETAETLLSRLLAARTEDTIIFISHRPEVAELCQNVLRLEGPKG